MNSRTKYYLFIIAGAMALKANAQLIDLASELKQLSDLSLLPVYRTGTIPGEESTYDRTGGNDDGFAGTYSFIRRNPDSSLVMLDIDGPGVLNRIATPTPTSDTLDFYIDHQAKPTFSICYMDLFSGRVFPFAAPLCGSAVGGFYSYFPILFQKHLMMVCRGHHLQFHQLQYRLFPAGTRVHSFDDSLTAAEKQALEQISTGWRSPGIAGRVIGRNGTIAPGDKLMTELARGGRINSIVIDTPGTANLRLQITWDSEKPPAIDCPVRAFFGFAFGQAAMQGLLAGQKDGKYYCYFPMPFDHHAVVALVNGGSQSEPVNITVRVQDSQRNPATEGKFYARYSSHHLSENNPFHVFLNIKGKGHYVGTILYAQGNFNGLPGFFEGDDTTATDGKCRIHGTGSEDYLNGGWYGVPGRWEHAESGYLSGCTSYGENPSHTGGFRFFVSDKISFETSFYHAIEHGGDRHGIPADYTSVSVYYCDRDIQQQTNP